MTFEELFELADHYHLIRHNMSLQAKIAEGSLVFDGVAKLTQTSSYHTCCVCEKPAGQDPVWLLPGHYTDPHYPLAFCVCADNLACEYIRAVRT